MTTTMTMKMVKMTMLAIMAVPLVWMSVIIILIFLKMSFKKLASLPTTAAGLTWGVRQQSRKNMY